MSIENQRAGRIRNPTTVNTHNTHIKNFRDCFTIIAVGGSIFLSSFLGCSRVDQNAINPTITPVSQPFPTVLPTAEAARRAHISVARPPTLTPLPTRASTIPTPRHFNPDAASNYERLELEFVTKKGIRVSLKGAVIPFSTGESQVSVEDITRRFALIIEKYLDIFNIKQKELAYTVTLDKGPVGGSSGVESVTDQRAILRAVLSTYLQDTELGHEFVHALTKVVPFVKTNFRSN